MVTFKKGVATLPYRENPGLEEIQESLSKIENPDELINIDRLHYDYLKKIEKMHLEGDNNVPDGMKMNLLTIDLGDTGYEEVFRRAKEAGIKIVSTDNVVSPDFRTTHVSDCDRQDIGSALLQSSVLIALGIDYPEDGNLEAAVQKAMKEYNGKELKIGVLSSAIDTTAQNQWIACMKNELEKDIYKGKVNRELDIKYGNDVPTEATTQANAFVAENKIDVIVSPTTVGLAAAGQVLKSSASKIKVTGLGLPHEMQSFMPASASDNAFDFVCPYMVLWDVVELGAAAGAASIAAFKGEYDG